MEYASTRLISFCTSAMLAARIAVNAPTDRYDHPTCLGVNWNSAEERATIYTPAVTMVAAWISADTGGGAFHRVRQPYIQRNLRRFASRAEEHQQRHDAEDAEARQFSMGNLSAVQNVG